MNRFSIQSRPIAALGITLLLVAACGGGPPASPTPAPATAPPGTIAPSEPAAETTLPTDAPSGPATLEAADSIEAGKVLAVAWTGPNAERDYVTIVAAGTSEWTSEDYFYTFEGSPSNLTTPSVPGPYELWYVSGEAGTVLFRKSITITEFQGDLLAPDEVVGNTTFEVAWNGPDGPGDYVTIVPEGAERWTNEDYFYTTEGSPSSLAAPLAAGAYEIWYVIGSDSSVQARRPITVTETSASLDAPRNVGRGDDFEVAWTGPDGPGDFVTIVPAGAEPAAYLSYFYTYVGPTGTLTAPDEAGDYEIRYVAGTGNVVLESVPIEVN